MTKASILDIPVLQKILDNITGVYTDYLSQLPKDVSVAALDKDINNKNESILA